MLIKTNPITRRRILRGAIGGGGVAVSLPFLDLFRNENGTAQAATSWRSGISTTSASL